MLIDEEQKMIEFTMEEAALLFVDDKTTQYNDKNCMTFKDFEAKNGFENMKMLDDTTVHITSSASAYYKNTQNKLGRNLDKAKTLFFAMALTFAFFPGNKKKLKEENEHLRNMLENKIEMEQDMFRNTPFFPHDSECSLDSLRYS